MPAPLLEQIDDQLQLIQAKLRDGSGTGSDLGALVASLVANIATSKTAVDALYDVGDAGTGIGPLADQQATTDLSALIVLAIAGET